MADFIPLAATVAAAVGFTYAAVSLGRQVRDTGEFAWATWYIMIIAASNAVFRYYTAAHRFFGWELPQPESTNIALVLQASLAAALVLIAAIGKLRRDVAREAARL